MPTLSTSPNYTYIESGLTERDYAAIDELPSDGANYMYELPSDDPNYTYIDHETTSLGSQGEDFYYTIQTHNY